MNRVLRTDTGQRAATDLAMAEDCVRHERMFFKRAGQETAVPAASPSCLQPAMLDQLRPDYAAMAVMIFGEVPAFDAVMAEHRGAGSGGEPVSKVASDVAAAAECAPLENDVAEIVHEMIQSL